MLADSYSQVICGPFGRFGCSCKRCCLHSGYTDTSPDIYVWQEYGYETGGQPKVIVDAGAYTGLSGRGEYRAPVWARLGPACRNRGRACHPCGTGRYRDRRHT